MISMTSMTSIYVTLWAVSLVTLVAVLIESYIDKKGKDNE